jgi:outer membrane receptor for ferrienterochelin and colicins
VFKNGGPVRVSINQTSYQNVRRELDAYALWKFDPKLGLRISLNNLLRQDNVFASSYVTDGAVLRRSAVAPSGVTVRAMVELKF